MFRISSSLSIKELSFHIQIGKITLAQRKKSFEYHHTPTSLGMVIGMVREARLVNSINSIMGTAIGFTEVRTSIIIVVLIIVPVIAQRTSIFCCKNMYSLFHNITVSFARELHLQYRTSHNLYPHKTFTLYFLCLWTILSVHAEILPSEANTTLN